MEEKLIIMEQQTFDFKEENHFLGFTNPSSNLKLNIAGDKKITAVEWLEQKIEKLLPDFIVAWKEEFDKAKQMEKEQIIKAYNTYYSQEAFIDGEYLKGEQYYNETYGE